MITEDKIKAAAANEAVYQRGCRLYSGGAVKNFIKYDAERYGAEVHGGEIYGVSVKLKQRTQIGRCACQCPAYYQYDGACKHIVATLKRVRQAQEAEEKAAANTKPAASRLFALFGEAKTAGKEKGGTPIQLIPSCHLNVYYNKVDAYLEFTLGRTRQYVMRDVEDFIRAMLYEQRIVYGKEFTLAPEEADFTPVSGALWEMMRDAFEDERCLKTSMSSSAIASGKKFLLSPSNLSRFFEIMSDTPFDLVLNGAKRDAVKIETGRPPIKFSLRDQFMNGYLSVGKDQLMNLDHSYRYILYNRAVIYKVDAEFSRNIKPLLRCFKESGNSEIMIEKEHMPRFFGSILPELESLAPVKVAPPILERFIILPLAAEIYIDGYENGVRAEIKFCYGEKAFNPAVGLAEPTAMDGKVLVRDTNAEQQILRVFGQYGFQARDGAYVQSDEERAYDFLADAVPSLMNLAEIYYEESFKSKRIRRLERVTAGVRVGERNMLEMTLTHSDFDLPELLDILSSYKLKKRYHRLKNGAFIPLESEELSRIADFMAHAAPDAKTQAGAIRLPLAKAVYLDTLAREASGLELERSAEFKKIVREIKEPVDAEIEIPESLAPILREYQKTGFKWLFTLARYGLGGILADDMGLGKTLQVIAFLLAKKQSADKPALVVTPTSLLYNWLDEIARFAPSLTCLVISGAKSERQKNLRDLPNVDVVITTYNTLKRDVDEYKDNVFRYCFLDEAQHIKNPNTQNAKAVKMLRTDGYFALTGTPIENTLTELWSIFDFLMPGYLFSHRVFKERFEAPIVKNGDERAAKELSRHIAPFILRRMKRDVLRELPEKIETTMRNEMTSAQQKIYAGYFARAQKEFEAELAARGFEQSRIKILSILTRLRQICCHPSLFLADYAGGSGKLDMLREIVADVTDGGRRVLIFSQFTSMLALIQGELDKMGLSYFYLDGKTPALERVTMAKSFNGGEKSVFLISLKAGGTGLNLTGAEAVVHYDPWWNPAVEEQATDRAYRLGQNNRVQVFKLITKDTIEENIFFLQQKKKALIDQMIRPGETFLSKLGEDELRALFMLK